MLLIKILSGPQTGQVIPLKKGVMKIGRSKECDVAILSKGVSKLHAEIAFDGQRLMIRDMDSRNGTFVNGVQIRKIQLQRRDKIALHDVFIEIVDAQEMGTARQYVHPPQQAPIHFPQSSIYVSPPQSPDYQIQGNAALNMESHAEMEQHEGESFDDDEEFGQESIQDRINDYLDEVVLPGVYKLPKMLEFKWVLGIFMGAFIILVTSLSTIPLLRILKASVERESQEHALTIAKTLVEINAQPLSQGINTGVSVAWALERSNVKRALVISNVDGAIISPASKAGSYPDIAYIHKGRKLGQESVEQVDGDTVVAMAPFEFYNPQTGSRGITAYSVVVFDMAALAVDDGRTLSLFIQTLFIAIIIGAILFFFLYKMICHPIETMNLQLNDALKNGSSHIDVDYEFDVLKELGANISSSLSRAASSDSESSSLAIGFEADRFQEMTNTVQLIGFGALAINASDRSITAVNEAFEDTTRISSGDLMSQPISSISDQALKANLEELVSRADNQPDQIVTDRIDFGGDEYEIAVSTVQGSQGTAYYLCVLYPGGHAEEGAQE